MARLCSFALLLFCQSIVSADQLTFLHHGRKIEVEGNVLGKDGSGTVLLESRDSQHYFIDPKDRLTWKKSSKAVPLYSKQQLRASLRDEFGPAFNIESNRRYLIAYSCSPEFAKQAGRLLEQVHDYFINYFRNKGGFRFEKLKQPLVAVIFSSRSEYLKYLAQIKQNSLQWSGGVYLQSTNRFYTFEDKSAANVNASLQAGPRAQASLIRNVEIIAHEGVHQMAYNLGVHRRYAYNPKWFVEGLALYFEAADLTSSTGWNGAGHDSRQARIFRRLYPQLDGGFLQALVLDDKAFNDAGTNEAAYAAAWALNYYLIRAKTRGYIRYVRLVSERPIKPYTAEERIADFKKAFGKSPKSIELDFRRFIAPVLATVK